MGFKRQNKQGNKNQKFQDTNVPQDSHTAVEGQSKPWESTKAKLGQAAGKLSPLFKKQLSKLQSRKGNSQSTQGNTNGGGNGRQPRGMKTFTIKDIGKMIRKANPVKSVGMKLFAIFFVAIMFFVICLGVMSYMTARGVIEKNAADAYQQTISQTADKLDIILERLLDTSTQVFFDSEMSDLLKKVSDPNQSSFDVFVNTDTVNKKLANIAFTNKAIESLYLYPEDKSKNPMGTGNRVEVREEPWFDEVLQTKGARWIPTDSEGKTFRLVRTMNDVSGVGGTYVLVMDLKTSILEEQLRGLSLGTGSRVDLVASDGTVVASTLDNMAGGEVKLDFVQEYTEPQGTKNLNLNIGDEQVNTLAVYTTLNSSQWILNGQVPVKELVVDARSILITTWIFAIVAAALAVVIGLVMIRMIARPLSNLTTLMLQGAKGDLRVRTKHRSQDEIGQLSASFNEMMEQITLLAQLTNNSAQDVLGTASELSDASKKTAVSAREIAVATEEIANGATSLATEAEKGNALTENISRQMELVIHSNKEMGDAARHVERSSEDGTKQLEQLMSKTRVTEETTKALVAKVDRLKETTASVFKVFDVLQNITKQTNILSLNATIEAARAGVAGRGFMVVADEIRQLADQSRQSIIMAGDIVDNIVSEMNETVAALSEVYPLFREQMGAVKDTTEIFHSVQQQMGDFVERLNSVTSSIQELNQSQSVLSDAMSNVSAVAEQSSATSEEVASLSSEQENVGNQLVALSGKLENVSNNLKETLSKFIV